MTMEYRGKSIASILALLLILTAPTAMAAESLAGSQGDVRYPMTIPSGTIGGCGKAYAAYVAAPGHSAFAATPIARTVEYFICGVKVNAPSQKAAEDLALKSCQTTKSKYKMPLGGNCSIAASK